MATKPVPFTELRQLVEHYHAALDDGFSAPGTGRGNARPAHTEAMVRIGLGDGRGNTSRRAELWLDTATALGIQVRSWRAVDATWAADQLRRYRTYDADFQDAESRLTRPDTKSGRAPRARGGVASPTVAPDAPGRAPAEDLADKIVPLLRGKALSLDEIAQKLQVDQMAAFAAVFAAHKKGASVAERGGKWHLDTLPPTGTQQEHAFQLVTDSDGYLEFGACGDQHLCSKYERLDCLADYYDAVQRRGISTVLNGGNWIDGESSFNKHDLLVHGADQQLQYLAKNYPQRDGVETWAIAGEDHEGWLSRREGVDIGRYAENVMRQNGRGDWHNLGFMECFIPIVHGDTGKRSQLCLMHPGGGSAYALSYAPQKIVEGFDGGAKPAVLLIAHYHKSSYQMTRNVHVVQVGCFQDQSLFMRQKKLAAHVGGWFCKIHVDPSTGAVDEFTGTFRNYFVKDFYAGRWSEHGPVNHVRRSAVP